MSRAGSTTAARRIAKRSRKRTPRARSTRKVFIEAIRDIQAGEELSYNYGIVLDEAHTAKLKKLWGCRCGAKGCTGTMLQPKKK